MTDAAKPDPIPDSYRRVTPCLVVRGAAKALEFYGEVFGASERMRFPGPDGTVAHAEIQIGDSVVIVEDEDRQRGTTAPPAGGLPGTPVFQFIYVQDVDATVARAVERGATVQRAAQDQFYGDRDALLDHRQPRGGRQPGPSSWKIRSTTGISSPQPRTPTAIASLATSIQRWIGPRSCETLNMNGRPPSACGSVPLIMRQPTKSTESGVEPAVPC